MTRKDYVLLAEALKAVVQSVDKPERTGAMLAAHELSYRLGQDNPRFDRRRFIEACGLEWNA